MVYHHSADVLDAAVKASVDLTGLKMVIGVRTAEGAGKRRLCAGIDICGYGMSETGRLPLCPCSIEDLTGDPDGEV